MVDAPSLIKSLVSNKYRPDYLISVIDSWLPLGILLSPHTMCSRGSNFHSGHSYVV